jgi:hypothetical protein
LSGLMRTFRARLPSGRGVKAEIHIGWLTPLLGALTMLNVVTWWANLFQFQNALPLGFDTIIIGLILCSFYYFAASMIFPDEPRAWPDVDEWFWLHRRQVIGCILAANVPFFLMTFNEPGTVNEQMLNAVVVIMFVGLLGLAMFAQKQWIVTAALATLVVVHLSFVPLDYLHRHGVW